MIGDASTSDAVTVTVSRAATTTTLDALPAAITAGEALTITATVAPAGATGTVTFLDGSTVLGTGTISGGTAAFSINTLGISSHSITARYEGDAGFAASTSTAAVTVNAVATSTTLAVSAGSIMVGQPLTFTATVEPTNATGTITFLDGSTTLGTANLSGGAATFTTVALSVGSHTITARYNGAGNHSASTSGPQVVSVGNPEDQATTTSLTASASSTTYGQSVTLTATVSPASATGSVLFYAGTTQIGTAGLSGGTATFTTAALGVGTHAITARYAGAAGYSPSDSTARTVTVAAISTTSSLTSSTATATVGEALTFTVSVAPAGATGTVTFFDGSATLGTATLANGTATLTTSALAVGSHQITARYKGDATHAPSAADSGVLVLIEDVTPTPEATTTILTASTTSPAFGQAVTFTATVNPPGAAGSVVFLDGSTMLGTATLSGGVATFTTTSLAPGSHAITARYEGDSDHASSTSAAVTVIVGSDPNPIPSRATTTTRIQIGPNPGVYGQPLTFTALVTAGSAGTPAGGQVRFLQGSNLLGIVDLTSGTATWTVDDLAPGTHLVRAIYEGNSAFEGSTSPADTLLILPALTDLTLAVAPAGAALGEPITLSARVAPRLPGTRPGTALPTGRVQFFAGRALLGEAAVGTDGVAALVTTPGADVLGRTVTARYLGDIRYLGADAPAVNLAPRPAPPAQPGPVAPPPASGPLATTTTLTVTMSARGGQVLARLEAVVHPDSGPAPRGGIVTFLLPHGRTRDVELRDGVAVLTLAISKPRQWSATAVYRGHGEWLSSRSAQVGMGGARTPTPAPVPARSRPVRVLPTAGVAHRFGAGQAANLATIQRLLEQRRAALMGR